MKLTGLILSLICLGCLLVGQTSPTPSAQKKVATVGYTVRGQGVLETGMASVTGREISDTDSLIKCSGDCELKVHNSLLSADEVDFHPKTGEAEARGNVRIKLLPEGGASRQ
jgi:lipopolysaccharide assembly outer membrane protein LptD (OstA)